MEVNNHIASIIARVLNEEASPEEKKELDDFLSEHPENERQFEMLRKVWALNDNTQPFIANNTVREDNERLARIKAKAASEREYQDATVVALEPGRGNRRKVFIMLMKYAAVVLVAVTAATLLLKTNKEQPANTSTQKEIAAENGSRKRVMLPDGTTVLLNSGSKIQYCTDFEGKTRDVTLFGEAFFDVAKNPKCPFVVHTGSIDIKVLGTAFNVKSYPDDEAVETTLIHGLVEINNKEQKDARPIFLHPNEKVSLPRCNDCAAAAKQPSAGKDDMIDRSGKIIILDSLAKDKEWVETAWIYNRLEFRKTNFTEISKKLERWYGVKITIDDDKLAAQTFNGSFENETLEQALKALQKTTSFTFKINNNEVFINASE